MIQGLQFLASMQPCRIMYKSLSNAVKPFPLAQYGGRFTAALLPGDGLGPELMGHVQNVFRHAGVPVDFEMVHLDSNNNTEEDFENAIIAIKRNGIALKGSIESVYGDPSTFSRNAALRTRLDLFANIIHCKSYPGVKSLYSDVDIVIIRENTQGEYSMLEHENVPGVVESLKIITRKSSERIARYAFEYAHRNHRRKVTAIHKANIMKISDGLFLETCHNVSKEYSDIEFTDMIIDNTCMQLLSKPQQFDVLVTPNLYGTVISNIICGMIGGAGLFSGRNYGEHYAVFEPGTRNTGINITGHNVANPVAMLNAACDLLNHLKLNHHESVIKNSVNQTINEDKVHTADLGGQASSIDVVQNVIKIIRETSSVRL